MKKLIFLLILFLPAFCFAQQCYTKTDAFTGKVIKQGGTFLLGKHALTGPVIIFGKEGDDYSITFSFEVGVRADAFDAEKMLFMVKFTDGTIKKFSANKKTRIVSEVGGVIVGFQSDLTAQDILYFKNNTITTVRLSYNGDESHGYDNVISEANGKNIIKSLDCIL